MNAAARYHFTARQIWSVDGADVSSAVQPVLQVSVVAKDAEDAVVAAQRFLPPPPLERRWKLLLRSIEGDRS